jgi:methionyl-tRNA formyltransferase
MTAKNNLPSPLNIAFFGTGQFALPALKNLLSSPDNITLVVTSLPAPRGRGQTVKPTPIALAAREAGLKVLETNNLNSEKSLNIIEKSAPDLLVVTDFGYFLGERLLNLGFVPPLNIHPSLLPRHRGPAPVNWTLILGDNFCGVTICFIELKVDCGDILLQKSMPVPPGMGAEKLEEQLSNIGGKLLMEAIERIKDDTIDPKPQNESLATINRLMTKKDGLINFSRPAKELACLINGVEPWPGAQAGFKDKKIKLFGALNCEGQGFPGQVIGLDSHNHLLIGTSNGVLAISEFQPESRSRMTAVEFSRGYHPEKLDNGLET